MELLSLPGGIVLGWCALEEETGHEAAYRLLETMYGVLSGEPMPPVEKTPRGKPFFPESPWHFSVAHTRRHAFVALGKTPLGIDAEETDRPIRLGLAEKILSPEELARFAGAKDPRQALLKLWVLKEAAAKQTGQGLQGYPNHTDFDPADPRILEIAGCHVAVIL